MVALIPAGLAAAGLASGCGSDSAAQQPASNQVPATTAKAAASRAAKPAAAAPADGAVAVKLTEWAVQPAADSAKAGKVTFSVTNAGKTPHEMVVVKTDKQAGAMGSGARVSEAGSAGEVGDLAPGATKKVTLKLTKGHYALICNMPGHYSSGMHADFTVS